MNLKELDQITRVKFNTDLGRWLERGWKGLSNLFSIFWTAVKYMKVEIMILAVE